MFLPLFCMKNYRHRTPRTYLSGLLSLKHDRIRLAFKKKTFEINGNYYKDDETTCIAFLCMLDIQNEVKLAMENVVRACSLGHPELVRCADPRAPSDLPTRGDFLACSQAPEVLHLQI